MASKEDFDTPRCGGEKANRQGAEVTRRRGDEAKRRQAVDVPRRRGEEASRCLGLQGGVDARKN